MLFTFGKTKTPLCSFCHSCDETIKGIVKRAEPCKCDILLVSRIL